MVITWFNSNLYFDANSAITLTLSVSFTSLYASFKSAKENLDAKAISLRAKSVLYSSKALSAALFTFCFGSSPILP